MPNAKVDPLVHSGNQAIAWVKDHMPILTTIGDRFAKEKPFRGLTIGMSIHLEAKTAYLAKTLKRGGAKVVITGCNPLSTKDNIVAALRYTDGIIAFGKYGIDEKTYQEDLRKVLEKKPDLIIDDGGDLLDAYLNLPRSRQWPIIGGCEETTTGVQRLKILEKEGRLPFPMVDVNDAECKRLFDNIHGTGQSALTAIMNTTNVMITGKTVVVAGFGHCGKGIAERAAGLGAKVIVTEINPVRAIEACYEGFEVMPMEKAAERGDIFITATGCKDVITKEHFTAMKNGAILCNSGHFNVEINLDDLRQLAGPPLKVKNNIEQYRIGIKKLDVLAEGRLVNLAAGDGHPAEIMDTSFALQALGLEWLVKSHNSSAGLWEEIYSVPEEINECVAFLALHTKGIKIDTLTEEQKMYLYGEE